MGLVTASRPGHAALPARAGIGLRSAHLAAVAAGRPDVGFLEVHTENYFHDGGREPQQLERLRDTYPLSLHGVGLSLGSVAPLDREHLRRVAAAERRFQPAAVSEHASWGRVEAEHFNDLLPLPFTEEAVHHLAGRVREVQDLLGRRMLVENISQYLRFNHSTLTEGEFLAAVVAESGCGLLIDVTNLHVNALNVGFDPEATIEQLPADAVGELHLSGHLRKEIDGRPLLISDHGSRVSEEVWDLYGRVLRRFGAVPTLIEWDANLPPLEVLLSEAARANAMLEANRAEPA